MPARSGAVLLALVLTLLAGCSLPGAGRPPAGPPVAPPEVYRSLDVCALVPFDQVKQQFPAIRFQYGGRLVGRPDSCWFGLADGTSVWVEPTAVPVMALDRADDVTSRQVAGGTVHLQDSTAYGCQAQAVSPDGIVLDVNGPAHLSTPAVRAAVCGLLDGLAELALGRLAPQPPTIAWPEGSVYATDLCALASEVGVATTLRLQRDEQVGLDHRRCTYRGEGGARVVLGASVGWQLAKDTPGVRALTVAGRPAELAVEAQSCTLGIDLGPNEPLAARVGTGTHEGLVVMATPPVSSGCEALVEAVTPLVERLG